MALELLLSMQYMGKESQSRCVEQIRKSQIKSHVKQNCNLNHKIFHL